MDTKNRILLIAFNVLLMFCTIFLNLLSVVTIRKSSQLKNKLCHFVILLQSAVDLGVGVFSITSLIAFLAIPLLGIRNCVGIGLLFLLKFLPVSLSTVILSAMTVERYIGVLQPYSYQTSVHDKEKNFNLRGSRYFIVFFRFYRFYLFQPNNIWLYFNINACNMFPFHGLRIHKNLFCGKKVRSLCKQT